METLKATKREGNGSHKAKHLREKGLMPGVVYGHKQATVAITVNRHDVELALAHGGRILEVEMEGEKTNVLIKEVQYDHMGMEMLHIDLARVDLDEQVEVKVPIILKGTPAGAADGGVLNQNAAEVSILCTVRSIPEEIRVNVGDMKVDDHIYMKDLRLPEGAKLLEDEDAIVCGLTLVVEHVAAEPVEGAPAEPEVIGAKKEEEEGAEGEEGDKKKAADKKKE